MKEADKTTDTWFDAYVKASFTDDKAALKALGEEFMAAFHADQNAHKMPEQKREEMAAFYQRTLDLGLQIQREQQPPQATMQTEQPQEEQTDRRQMNLGM
jgi:hypothetical protein